MRGREARQLAVKNRGDKVVAGDDAGVEDRHEPKPSPPTVECRQTGLVEGEQVMAVTDSSLTLSCSSFETDRPPSLPMRLRSPFAPRTLFSGPVKVPVLIFRRYSSVLAMPVWWPSLETMKPSQRQQRILGRRLSMQQQDTSTCRLRPRR